VVERLWKTLDLSLSTVKKEAKLAAVLGNAPP
jgi:hypothetical protein